MDAIKEAGELSYASTHKHIAKAVKKITTMSVEKQIFDLLEKIGEGIYDEIHIIYDEVDDDYVFKIYHGKGFCWEVKKEYNCEPEEVATSGIDSLDWDGNMYYFTESFDGFKESGIEYALKEIRMLHSKTSAQFHEIL